MISITYKVQVDLYAIINRFIVKGYKEFLAYFYVVFKQSPSIHLSWELSSPLTAGTQQDLTVDIAV